MSKRKNLRQLKKSSTCNMKTFLYKIRTREEPPTGAALPVEPVHFTQPLQIQLRNLARNPQLLIGGDHKDLHIGICLGQTADLPAFDRRVVAIDP